MLLKIPCLTNNWSFPSSKNSHFQNGLTCKPFLIKMVLFTLILDLKQRLGATRTNGPFKRDLLSSS